MMTFNDFIKKHNLKKQSNIKYKNTTSPFIPIFE